MEGVLLCSPNSYKRVVEYNAEEYVVEIKPSHLTREAVQDTMKRMIKELGSIEEYVSLLTYFTHLISSRSLLLYVILVDARFPYLLFIYQE